MNAEVKTVQGLIFIFVFLVITTTVIAIRNYIILGNVAGKVEAYELQIKELTKQSELQGQEKQLIEQESSLENK